MIANNVQGLNAPQGMARTPSGLYIPQEYAQKGILDANNQKLLGLKEELGVSDLELHLVDNYIQAIKNNAGVISYHQEVKKENLVEMIMQTLSYHIHNRHFKGLGEKVKELHQYVDPLGKHYDELVVSALTGMNKVQLTDIFTENPDTPNVMYGLSKQISRNYLNLQVAETLKNTYNENLDSLRTGLKNLNDIFGLEKLFKTNDLPNFGKNELNQNYLKGLNEAWDKIEASP